MKRYIFLSIASLIYGSVQSQEVIDALRYSQEQLNGTARYSALSGAFGALGGDLSSLNVNPAGSAIFSNNQIGVTLSSFGTKNNSNYSGNVTSDSNNNLDMNQLGAVFVFKDANSNNKWKKFAVGVNYENKNNFNNSVFSAGRNRSNSISNYFLHYANYANNGTSVPHEFVKTKNEESISNLYSYLGAELPNLQYQGLSGFAAQQAMLGFQGYVINAVDNNNNNSLFVSNTTAGGNYYQENSISAQGYNGKLSFNTGTSYEDKLYLGINLNSHFSNFTQSTLFYERNSNPLNTDYTVKKLNFENNLQTFGTGFSLQIGAIAKVTSSVRLGLAYESPTWYSLTDELSQNLTTVRATGFEEIVERIDPQIINYYEPYRLSTPAKWTGSFAYIFGKRGLISIDYALKDFTTTQFTSQINGSYNSLNRQMTNLFTVSNEFRIGAEYKIKEWSLRSGYRFEGSPYKDKTTIGNLNSLSAGLGYNFGAVKLDLSYMNAQRETRQGFFGQGFTDVARINSMNNNLSLTMLIEL